MGVLKKLTEAFDWRSEQAGTEDIKEAELANKDFESTFEDRVGPAED